jgi:DNA-binding NarL/FixJ family response regulator
VKSGPAPHREGAAVPVAVGRFSNVVRRGILDMLREDKQISVIGEGLDELELESMLASTDAVVLLDEAEVLSTASHLRAAHSDLAILVLARHPTPVYGRTLLALGVSCLDWSTSSEDLVATLHQSYFGRTVFLAGNSRAEHEPGAEPPLLTPREFAVLALLSQRKSYEEIALLLALSLSTVKVHAASIRAKLKAKRRRELSDLPMLMVPPQAPHRHARL